MKTRYAKLNIDIFAKRKDPESWIEVNSSFKGSIVGDDKGYVILSDSGNGVSIRVKKSDITEILSDH